MYCRKCGLMLSASDRFCAKCGSPSSAQHSEEPFLIPPRDGQKPKVRTREASNRDMWVLGVLFVICLGMFINGQPLVKYMFSIGMVYFVLSIIMLSTLFMLRMAFKSGRKEAISKLMVAIPIIGICIYFYPKPANLSNTQSDSVNEVATKTTLKDDLGTDAGLMRVADAANRNLPKMIDAETRLDHVSGAGKTIVYSFTLVNYTSQTLSDVDLQSDLYNNVLNSVCTNTSPKTFIDAGVTVTSIYFGKDRKLIGTISIHPSQCK
jgi:hypothetical protein